MADHVLQKKFIEVVPDAIVKGGDKVVKWIEDMPVEPKSNKKKK
jgi:hypothetical protein